MIRLAAALATLVPTIAFAGNTLVSPDAFKAAGKTGHVYGRSDGVFQEGTTRGVYIIENGQPAQPVGVGYRETFSYGAAKGLAQLDSGGGGTCAGNTTTVPCIATFGSGVKLAWFPIVTATLPLATVASGLNISSDLVDNDGLELAGGVLGASGRPFIVGRDPAFYFCATALVTDVSGTDDFHVGFREAEPFNAVFDNYTDLASIGIVGTAAKIQIETILNDAATVTTDTTLEWADGETKKLCAYVSAAGAVTYKVDDRAPPTTAAYSFAAGLPVIPFVHLLHATDVAEDTVLKLWEVGFQP